MKINDLFFFIKKNFLEYNNINTIIILTTIICLSFISYSTIEYSIRFKKSIINSLDSRTLVIEQEVNENEIKKIKNVKDVVKLDDIKGTFYSDKQFDSKNYNSEITIKPILDDKKIIYGNKIGLDNEIICSDNFYPYSLYVNKDYKSVEYMDKKKIVGKDIIGKYVTFEDSNLGTIKYKVVGLYENKESIEINTCYVKKDEFHRIYKPSEVCSDEECTVYNPTAVIVDDYKNIEDVKEKLSSAGIFSFNYTEFDEKQLNIIINTPIIFGVCSLLLVAVLSFLTIKKVVIKNQLEIALEKIVGFNNKDIYIIKAMEMVLNVIVSSIISSIFYLIIVNILNSNLLNRNLYYNINCLISLRMFIVFAIAWMMLICLLLFFLLRKNNKNGITLLFGDE